MVVIKNCIGGWFCEVLKDLYEFFKFNLFCYNILKILKKKILIININLAFSTTIFFSKGQNLGTIP